MVWGETLTYAYIPDTLLENARNVSISLHNREGASVKVHLYFAAKWIVIGEVTFVTSKRENKIKFFIQ